MEIIIRIILIIVIIGVVVQQEKSDDDDGQRKAIRWCNLVALSELISRAIPLNPQ